VVGDEVRDARVDGRAEEAVRETGHRRQGDDPPGARRERQRNEDPDADGVGGDHQRASLEPVEERPEQEADDDRRQELDDEDGPHPEAVVRPLLNINCERDGRDQRPRARAERGEEEVPESRKPERRELG